MKRTKRRIKWKNIFIFLCFIEGILLLCYAGTQLFKNHKENKEMDEEVEKINQIVEVNEVASASSEEKEEISLIELDFSELKKINSDTVAWIQVGGTTINYPVVATSDNKYYLTHSFYKNKNSAGWVFMDYRNEGTFNHRNTIIYAHGRVNGIMFGSLKDTLKEDWQKNEENHYIKIGSENESTIWEVFSVYRIKTTSDYLKINFQNDQTYQEFLNMLKERSVYNFGKTVSSSDKIITLSTCYNESDKVVMHARLKVSS